MRLALALVLASSNPKKKESKLRSKEQEQDGLRIGLACCGTSVIFPEMGPTNSPMQLGGAEIVLILGVLFILAICVIAFLVVIYLIVRAFQNRPLTARSISPEEQRERDREHLRLLAIFHFVAAGLALLGVGFVFAHYFIMHTVFANPEMWKAQKEAPPPKEFFQVFIWVYFISGAALVLASVLNLLSGVFLLRKRNRIFSIVVAALNCFQIPVGTALGVFTMLVLSRESVREWYGRNALSNSKAGLQ